MAKATTLLDVNVLIALLDPRHVHHELCHGWFASRGDAPWASCAITQNAVLRILGNPRYPNSPGPPASVVPHLDSLEGHPNHQFWESNPSLLDQPFIDVSRWSITRRSQISTCWHWPSITAAHWPRWINASRSRKVSRGWS